MESSQEDPKTMEKSWKMKLLIPETMGYKL